MEMAKYLQVVEPLIGSKGDDGCDDDVLTTAPEVYFFPIPDPESRSPALRETFEFAGFDGYIMLHPITGEGLGLPVVQVGSPLDLIQTENGTPNPLLLDFLKELQTENSRHHNQKMTRVLSILAFFCLWFLIFPVLCPIEYNEYSQHLESRRNCHDVVPWLLLLCLGLVVAMVCVALGKSKASVAKRQERLKQFFQRQQNKYGNASNDHNLSTHHPRRHICEYYWLEYRPRPMAANPSKRTSLMDCYLWPDYIFFVRKTRPTQKQHMEKAQLSTSSLPSPALMGSNSNNETIKTTTSSHQPPNQLYVTGVVDEQRDEQGGTNNQFLLPVGQVSISADLINIIQAMPMNQGYWKEFCAEYHDLVALKARMDQVFCRVGRVLLVLVFSVRVWILLVGSSSAVRVLDPFLLLLYFVYFLSVFMHVRKERIFAGWVMMQLKVISHKHKDDPTHICGIMDIAVMLDVKVKCSKWIQLSKHLLSFRHFPREPADQAVLHQVPPLRPCVAATLDRLSLWDLLVPSRDFWEQLAEELTTQKAVGGNRGRLCTTLYTTYEVQPVYALFE